MTLAQFQWLSAGLLFVSGLAGGLLPWRLRRGANVEFGFSLGNAFAGGVFLAVGLIHMLGDAAAGFAARWPDSPYPFAFLLAGCTFMGLLLIERVLVPPHFDEVRLADEGPAADPGARLSAGVLLLTLSIHSVLAGLALGAQQSLANAGVILIALLAHKGIAGFALGVSLSRGGVDWRGGAPLVAGFAVTTPLGVAGGSLLSAYFASSGASAAELVFNALAAGTFLYIASLDIFSEEFLRPQNRNCKFLASSVGFAAMALVAVWT